MGRKKKSKKKKPLQPNVLTPDIKASATSIIEKFEGADPTELVAKLPDASHAQAIIDQVCVGETPSVPLLLALKDGFEDKQVRKAVKRALFKLKQRGISVEEYLKPEGTPAPILKAPQEEKPGAYVGPVLNMFGSRAVLITYLRGTKGRHMGMGLASDEDGIHEFLYGVFSKKRTKEMKGLLSGKAGPLVETSLSHAATILEQAYQQHEGNQADIPPDYLELRPWLLENAPLIESPVIYDFVKKNQIENKIMTDSQLERLFQHNLMEAWLIEYERLKPFMEELMKSDDSLIVLSDDQKTDQAKRIKEKCMEELFPDSQRALLKRRLEEMAFVFFRLGEEDFCRLSLNAARITVQEDNSLMKNPVIEFFLERSFDFYMNLIQKGTPKEQEPEESSSPNIIIP
jgi:hypothetical protein